MMPFRPFTASLGLLTLAALALSSCEPQLDSVPAPSAGMLNFSRYVAFGDDYTAGVSNGGVTAYSQEYSFPNLLARQLAFAGGGGFEQPLLAAGESTGGLALLGLNDRNQALVGPAAVTALDAELVDAATPCERTQYRFPAWAGVGRLPQNLGVPGLRLAHLETPGLGDDANLRAPAVPYNGYLERLLPDGADNVSYTTLVAKAQPTFFTVSIGLSDIMPFVRTGGTCGPLPTAAAVSTLATRFLDSLVATTGTAKGVILGVPSPFNLPLTRTRVSEVNRQLGRAADAPVYVLTAAGPDPVVAAAGDVVLLPMVSRIGRLETATGAPAATAFGLTTENPLRDEDVLSEANITAINTLINGRNGLKQRLEEGVAKAGGRLMYVDLVALFGDMTNGRYIDGISYSGDPVTGGLFSYDGYSLSPRGNAVLVNHIIENINKDALQGGFNSNLPRLDISSMPPLLLP